jgi:hypothetical protein
LFHIASVEDDAKVFLFSIAYFFPNALNEPPLPPEEQDLLAVINWFLKTWRGETPRPRRLAARRASARISARRG